MNITMTQLAELKQVSRAAVSKKVKQGKLDAAIVLVGSKKKLNRDIALDLWDKNTDPNNDIVREKVNQKVNLMDQIEALPKEEIPEFSVSRARKMKYDADLAAIEVKVKEGLLVDAKETEHKAYEMAIGLRNKLMILPDRVSSFFALEKDAAVIGKILKEELMLAIRSAIPEGTT